MKPDGARARRPVSYQRRGARGAIHRKDPAMPTVLATDRRADLQGELAALRTERDRALAGSARADLGSEQAAALLEHRRQQYDAAITAAKEAALAAQTARRALGRHEAAIREVEAEIAALGAGGS
jgi:hypothetical protein